MASRPTARRTPPKARARTTIAVQGARVHNLKNISVEIPRDKLIVVTGLSGSGKSSLAFDTIYAEGQRRYMESLSSFAKRFVAAGRQARRRLRLRALAGDLDRAEDHRQQPALDRRDHDRHRQLSEPAVRDHRRAALPAHGRADAQQDGKPDPRGSPVSARRHRDRAARAGVQGLRRGAGLRPDGGAEERVPAADDRRQAGGHLRAGRARRTPSPAHGRGGGPAGGRPQA